MDPRKRSQSNRVRFCLEQGSVLLIHQWVELSVPETFRLILQVLLVARVQLLNYRSIDELIERDAWLSAQADARLRISCVKDRSNMVSSDVIGSTRFLAL